ncbi:DMT family transporter [Ruegeria marina]|uniref:Threonine/homoserine efflux transporter RhtA n=1 Tax=Ruegeria marina TaxID=639004 RepID=A0A1G6QIE4_9RHOB|nr:DMT family transporter [Ruegeria marina]SDC92078.1 Threonine/homoserine efflux transporter RhtA [Ruegeria marina]
MSQSSRQAIVYMVLAILFFTLMDATVKALTPRIGVIPALWARYTGQMVLVVLLVLPRLHRVARTRYPRLQLLRSLMLMGATWFFFIGISRIPLTDASALMAVNPVLITLGAALFLGEALGPRRILGIAIALAGAMIILRPGSALFQPAALFPLAAAACYSTYALLTRRVGPDEDVWTSLLYTGLIGTIILSLVVAPYWQTPDLAAWGLIVLVVGFGTMGQLSLIRAFSQGEAAMLAPYAYCGLGFAAVWSAVFFGEYPDVWTILGALVIAGAGLYVWHREMHSR